MICLRIVQPEVQPGNQNTLISSFWVPLQGKKAQIKFSQTPWNLYRVGQKVSVDRSELKKSAFDNKVVNEF